MPAPEAAPSARPTAAAPPSPTSARRSSRRSATATSTTMRRVAAEFDNYKKRVAREQQSTHPAGDRAARSAACCRCSTISSGPSTRSRSTTRSTSPRASHLVHRALRALLEREGLAGDRPDGEPFDPHSHEALLSQPSDAARGLCDPGRPEGLRARRPRAAPGPRRRRGARGVTGTASPPPPPSPRPASTAPARSVTGLFWALAAGVWVRAGGALITGGADGLGLIMVAVAVAAGRACASTAGAASRSATRVEPDALVVVVRRGERRLDGPVAERAATRSSARPARARLGRPVRLPRPLPPAGPPGPGPRVRERPAPRRRALTWASVAVLVSPQRQGGLHLRRGGARCVTSTRRSASQRAPRRRDQEGVPQAGPEVAPRQEPGRREGRGAVQGDLGRLRHALRRREAQGLRPVRRVRRHVRPAASTRAASATTRRPRGFDISDLLGDLFGRARGGGPSGGRAGARARARARPADLRQPVVRRRPHRRAAEDPGARRRHRAPTATAPAPRPAPARPSARSATGRGVRSQQPGLLLALRAVPALRRLRPSSSSTPARPARPRQRGRTVKLHRPHPGRHPGRQAAAAARPGRRRARRRPARRPAGDRQRRRPRRCSSGAATTSWSRCR